MVAIATNDLFQPRLSIGHATQAIRSTLAPVSEYGNVGIGKQFDFADNSLSAAVYIFLRAHRMLCVLLGAANGVFRHPKGISIFQRLDRCIPRIRHMGMYR